MTFKEFSAKVKEDVRLTDLINRYDNFSLTDEELQEMVDRSAAICDDDDAYADSFLPADDDPIWNESPVDLFGAWWE